MAGWERGPHDQKFPEREGVEGFLRSQGRNFSPERCSAHEVGFRPLPVTSRVVQRTGRHSPGPQTGGCRVAWLKQLLFLTLPFSLAPVTNSLVIDLGNDDSATKGQHP